MSEQQVEPHVFVIIGATGDLTRRKLLPALFSGQANVCRVN